MAYTLLVDGCYRDEDDCAVQRLPSVQPAEPGAAANGHSVVRSSVAGVGERAVPSTRAAETVAGLTCWAARARYEDSDHQVACVRGSHGGLLRVRRL